jgi:hypothetical protein
MIIMAINSITPRLAGSLTRQPAGCSLRPGRICRPRSDAPARQCGGGGLPAPAACGKWLFFQSVSTCRSIWNEGCFWSGGPS